MTEHRQALVKILRGPIKVTFYVPCNVVQHKGAVGKRTWLSNFIIAGHRPKILGTMVMFSRKELKGGEIKRKTHRTGRWTKKEETGEEESVRYIFCYFGKVMCRLAELLCL